MRGLFVPVVNGLERLFEPAQHFGWSWPLHVFAVILHEPHVVEAPGNLLDVGLHFVAPVILEDCEGGFGPLVAQASQCASPDLPGGREL